MSRCISTQNKRLRFNSSLA